MAGGEWVQEWDRGYRGDRGYLCRGLPVEPGGKLGEPGRASLRDPSGSLLSGEPSGGERSGTKERRCGGVSAGLTPEASEPVRRAEGG